MSGGNKTFIDPAYETAEEVKDILEAQQLLNSQSAKGKLDICFTKDKELAERNDFNIDSAGRFQRSDYYTIKL